MRASRARFNANLSAPAPACSSHDDDGAAAQEFRRDLVSRFATGKLEAIDLCTLAWRSTKAGARGVEDLAVDPNQKGDNHAKVVRKALGLDKVSDAALYELHVPLYDAATGKRTVRPLPVKLPHEALARDFMNNSAAYWKARSDHDNIMVPGFVEHPLTKVKVGSDSFYRGSVKCTVLRSSITCWVIKCPELCRCGCNGMCTIDALQMEMNNSLNALQRATFIESRFDNRPWLASDRSRRKRAGRQLGFIGAVTEYRADLPERCAAARVKNQQGYCGCLGCH